MNEWYLRDCGRKIKAVLQAKGRDGKPITNNPPYGYIKDPEDKNRCDMSKPYEWAGVSVVRMLEKPEYMGDTVNFRTKKLSYKDKVAVKNDSDEIVVFTDTHEAIIDRKTWYMVQELRKTKRRINTEGESNPFVGKIFCADCGGKMHYRNEESVPEENGEDCRMAVSEQLQPVITAAIIITAMTSQERSAVRTIYRQR